MLNGFFIAFLIALSGCNSSSLVGNNDSAKADQKELMKIREESQKTLVDFPTAEKIESMRLTANGKSGAKRIRVLLESASQNSKWTQQNLDDFTNEIEWATMFLQRANDSPDGPGGGTTCATNCRTDYNKCMKENDCTSSFFCLCCVPCSLQYMGCIGRCMGKTGGLHF